MIECRRNHPGTSGFPVMQLHAWCWEGKCDSFREAKLNEDRRI